MSLLKNTKVVGAVVVVVILVIGWWWWSSGSSSSAPPAVTTASSSSPASQSLLTLLGSLHSIQLDPSIFTDPNFTALSDFNVTIPNEPAGRTDPFAPIGSQNLATSTP